MEVLLRNKNIANEVREQLNKQYVETDIMSVLEKTYGMSIAELNELFVMQYGIAMEEYLNNRRFNAAKELLRFSNAVSH